MYLFKLVHGKKKTWQNIHVYGNLALWSINEYKLSIEEIMPTTPIVPGLNLIIPKLVNGNIKSQLFFTVSINKSLWLRTNWTASPVKTSLGVTFLLSVFMIFLFRNVLSKLFSSIASLTRFKTMDSNQYLLPILPHFVAFNCMNLFLFNHTKWSHNKYKECAIFENVTQNLIVLSEWFTVRNAVCNESIKRPNLNTGKKKLIILFNFKCYQYKMS